MSTKQKPLMNQNLLYRVFSALALIPVVLGAVWMGEWVYLVLVALILGIGMYEWLGLTAKNLSLRGKIWAFASLFVVLGVGAFKGMPQAVGLSLLATLLLAYYAGLGLTEKKKETMAWVALGLPYLAWSGLAMIHVRNVPDIGFALTLFLLLTVWATDTGAFFAGRKIGGPKLLPQISPSKTWAGLGGGMVLAAIVGYAIAWGYAGEGLYLAAGIGAVIAIVSQAGDFFESYVKRRAGAKDSGTIIPGHGGVLDRVDGLLVAALFLSLLVWIVG